MPSSVIAELLCPKQGQWNKIQDFSIESIRFIGFPVSVNQRQNHGRILKVKSLMSLDSDVSSKVKETVAVFNIVFAFDIEGKTLFNIESIKEAVIEISKTYTDQTLKFEEKRNHYMSIEITKIKAIRDSDRTNEAVNQNIVTQTSLGKELSEIYCGLCAKGECLVEINSWLRLNLFIQPTEHNNEILPFQSLLFKESQKRLESVILDKSIYSILGLLVKKCKFPVNSFKDISESEGIPIESIYEGALHFVAWRKAKIITVLNPNSYFANSPGFELNDGLVKNWEKVFKNKNEFEKMLNLFSRPISAQETEKVLTEKPKTYATITWLLKKNIIYSLNYYLYLFITKPMPITKTFSDEVNLSVPPDNSDEYETLLKIYKYCTGNCQIEEIVCVSEESYENVVACVKHYNSILKMILR